MSRTCLCLARVLLGAWVGAAVLFVINGVSTVGEVPSPVFDQLTVIRFPNYYRFGFTAVGLGGVALLCSLRGGALPRIRGLIAAVLVAAAIVVMVYDYRQVYKPLEHMITPPGQARPMEFVSTHERSKNINALHVGLCLIATVLICWPAPAAMKLDDPAD